MKKLSRRSFLINTGVATTAAFAMPSIINLNHDKILYDGKKIKHCIGWIRKIFGDTC